MTADAPPRMPPTIEDEIGRYLRTGKTDPYSAAWPGGVLSRAKAADADLRRALIAEVTGRAGQQPAGPLPESDLTAFTHRKVKPMIDGLFPRKEREIVLTLVERSVVILTPENVAHVLESTTWLGTAWDIANLYLLSVGAEPLGPEAPHIVGLSEETTCYVSAEYFRENDTFSDFLVHEVAHICHNCKRRTAGLPETRTREWLLDIDYRKRETFAYACEAYSRILEQSTTPAGRGLLLDGMRRDDRPRDKRVDPDEYLDILHDAVMARNGWKRILARCSPVTREHGSTGRRS